MSNSAINRMMTKYGQKVEEKMNQIKFLQDKVNKVTTNSERDLVDKKLKSLIEELYG